MQGCGVIVAKKVEDDIVFYGAGLTLKKHIHPELRNFTGILYDNEYMYFETVLLHSAYSALKSNARNVRSQIEERCNHL